MSCRAGILPLSILALGSTSPATTRTVSLECKKASYLLTPSLLTLNLLNLLFHIVISFYRDLGNAELSGHLVPELGVLKNLQYL